MATAFSKTTTAEQVEGSTASTAVQYESTCARCGGLLVPDFAMDLLFCIGETKFAAQRCVQCGEMVDPVILRNRRMTHESVPAQPVGRMMTNNPVTNGRGRFALQNHGTGFRCVRGLEGQAQQK